MNASNADREGGRTGRVRRATHLLFAAAALLASAAPLAGQATTRLWAAQTGPDQVTLAWDSIPDAAGYRIYVGAPGGPGARPAASTGARSRQSVLFGIERLSAGIYLVATAANGRTLQQAQFNPVARATSFPPIAPPAEVTADAASATEISVSWTPVPGATAYYIARAAAGSGFRPLCGLCSTEARYIDRSILPGFPHAYSVAAIFPNGRSQAVSSNQVAPGVTQVASTGATTSATTTAPAPTTSTKVAPTMTGTTPTSTTPPATTTTYSTSASYDSTTHTTTYTYTTTVCTVTAPITCTSTRTYATRTDLPPPSPTSATTSTSPTTATSTTASTSTASTPTAAPDTANATSTGLLGGISNVVSGAIGTWTGAVKPPASVSAVSPAPASVRLTWEVSPTAGVTGYRVSRRVNAGAWQVLSTVGSSTLAYADAFFPITMFAAGPVSLSYSVVAVENSAYSSAAVTGTLTVQPPAPSASTTTTAGTTTSASCKLDYQRADNMWAAMGRPDGQLGTETISLAAGQDKVFITDWAYEKQRNDGTNYYGSHLRIATNGGTRAVRLQVRTLALTSWIRLDPGKTQQFQADLMEVFCEN